MAIESIDVVRCKWWKHRWQAGLAAWIYRRHGRTLKIVPNRAGYLIEIWDGDKRVGWV